MPKKTFETFKNVVVKFKQDEISEEIKTKLKKFFNNFDTFLLEFAEDEEFIYFSDRDKRYRIISDTIYNRADKSLKLITLDEFMKKMRC